MTPVERLVPDELWELFRLVVPEVPARPQDGVWAKLHRVVLDELGARGELDWSWSAVDPVNMRALEKGS